MSNVKETEYYKKVNQVVDNLYASGLISNGSGYCLSMSDIVYKLLYKEGIKSKLVECSLMITLKNPPGLFLMGYTGFHEIDYDPENKMENHIVCITETEVPILIDTSISNIDRKIKYICEPIESKCESANMCEFDFETSSWLYQQKPESELPDLHQKSIVDRINQDNQFKKQISFIQKFLIVLLGVSSLNLIRGSYDFYQTYFNRYNNWGPSKSLNK